MANIQIEELEPCPEFEAFAANAKLYKEGFVRIQPGGSIMPRCYLRFHQQIQELELREDDIWVASFPKCGTTWTQEMVWNIVHNVNLEAAKQTILDKRVPFLELTGLTEEIFTAAGAENPEVGLDDSLEEVNNLPSPRVIKTHLAVELLPPKVVEKAKLIYVARNPRDVVVSLHSHWKVLDGYQGDFSEFFDAFIADMAGYYCPFIPHNIGYWNIRNQENVLFIFYEEMKKDLGSVIRRVCKFLEKDLSEDQISVLTEHLQFDSMKKNPAVNKEDFIQKLASMNICSGEGKFMRSGKTGDWRDKLTQDQVDRIYQWEHKHLKGSDLKFIYNL